MPVDVASVDAARAYPRPSSAGVILNDLRQGSVLYPLPAIFLAGLLLVLSEDRFRSPLQVIVPGMTLCLLPLAVVLLRRLSHLAAAWTLVLGSFMGVWLASWWTPLPSSATLLSLPIGLAALLISAPAGVASAAFLTAFMWLVPPARLPVDAALRFTTVIGAWSMLGLIWLSEHPLVTTMEWSWSSFEQSQRLLERARDLQAQLKQTLADLASANVQLTRLNRLTDGLRRAADEARQAKEQFVAHVSHELRTPLNMIIGFSEMVVRAPQTYGKNIPPALLADLEVILRNSQHLSSLIDDVLDLSQIEAGKVVLSKERVALPELIEAAATAVRPLFQAKSLYLHMDLADDLPLVMCDRTRIRAVILNLLSNAGRFTGAGGVLVRAWRQDNNIAVSVADTGPGISADDREKLFRPFEQLDGSIRRRYGGSGLGLTISKGFVELHGGRMWLTSEKGVGTVFQFTLPIDPPVPVEPSAVRWINPAWHYEERVSRSLAPAPVVRPRVVVLESGNSLHRLLNRSWEGVEVFGCVTLREALAEIARVPVQALLVNADSPSAALAQLSGTAALPPGIPVIAFSIPGAQEAAGALGVADYLVKPVSQEALLGALDRIGLSSGTVLVADDEPDLLRMFDRILGAAGRGYQVLRANDGRQALEIMRAQRPDVVLLDLGLPETDGFRLLEIRSQEPELQGIPVIVISARDPTGQPIVSSTLAATRAGGLSVSQLLVSLQALSQILGPGGQAADPVPPGKPAG